MRYVHSVLVAVGVLLVVSGAGAATTNYAFDPAFQQEAIVANDGSFVSGGSFSTRIAWGTFGETRGVYEYYLPVLPTGSTVSAASLSYRVLETQSANGNASQLGFFSYAGDGSYSSNDAQQVSFSEGTSPKFFSTGSQTQSLSTSRLATIRVSSSWYGLVAWQEQSNFRTGIARGSSGAPPRLNLTVDAPTAGTLVTGAMFDALASNSGGGFSLDSSGLSINTQKYDPVNVDRRGVMEFHLGGLPDGAHITGASITFKVAARTSDGASGGPDPIVYGYTGNGTANISDATQTALQLAVGPEVTGTGMLYTIQLDAAGVQSLLATGDILGILMYGSADAKQFSFYTAESGQTPVSLSIAYSVPEPGSATAAIASLLLLTHRRRRSR